MCVFTHIYTLTHTHTTDCMFVFPQIHRLKPVMVLGDRDFEKRLGHKGGALMIGISAESFFALSTM